MRVTLLNEGMDAYKPAEYGRRIMVERKINKGGGGGYTLLGITGGNTAHENGRPSNESYTVIEKSSPSLNLNLIIILIPAKYRNASSDNFYILTTDSEP